jgi:hypothetical protein
VSLTPDETTALRSSRINLAFFLRAEIGGDVLRLAATAGSRALPADGVETTGGTYLGCGAFTAGLPDIDLAMNGQAQGLTLQLSGVDPETIQQYLLDRDAVIGAQAAFGWAVLDERYRPLGEVRWPMKGLLFQPRVRRQRTKEGRWTRTISVTLVAGSYARRRGLKAYATAADHRRAHPTDGFFDLIATLNRGSTRKWPN